MRIGSVPKRISTTTATARITAADVARHAGVSQPTVSLILSKNPNARVAKATRARVLAVAKELGYRPNRLAQGLVHQRSFALGVIVPGFANPVYANIVSGAERVASDQGYAVLLCEAEQVNADEHLRALIDRQVDGVVIAGVAASTLPSAELARLNVVLVNQPSDGHAAVGADSHGAGRIAARHLLDLGHTRIAFIGPSTSLPAFRLRERGFADELRSAGLPPASDYWQRAEANVAAGAAAMRVLLELPLPPTAVFCATDVIALGAHKEASRAGLRLGVDLSIIGCDDIEMATLVSPELTSIRTPQRELGARAVRALIQRIEDDSVVAPTVQILPVKLVRRGSTGRPPPSPSTAPRPAKARRRR
jgi:LacI family transcriptional regulator, galactose operon repressor